jgi:dihydroorotate dehydrogenase (fumarate)
MAEGLQPVWIFILKTGIEMADLTTKYMGLVLKNPVIVGSCGLTSSIEKIKELESNGAAAIVLKSLFEEEILVHINKHIESAKSDGMLYTDHSESLDYIDLHIKDDSLKNYLNLIRQSKAEILIPVIASINCISASEWTDFAKKIEDAGADAIELNIFLNPSDISGLDFEKAYHTIISSVLSKIKIPVSVKISQYFTKPGKFILSLSNTGIKAVVLFNRFYLPDIDIDKIALKEAEILSTPAEFNQVLRWIGILSGKLNISLAASTGIFDGSDIIKQILAGADAVQVVSTLYKHGPQQINKMLIEIETWMDKQGFNSLNQFKGKLSMAEGINPAAYERMQFMKYFGGIK